MTGDTRLRLYRNPLRLAVSASPWLGGWYLACYVLVTGWLLFSVAVTAATTALALAVTSQRELRSRGSTTRDAVVGGISSSAGVVTSAAVIMVAVFSILARLPIVDTKTLGMGLAAVLIDATVVRGILLPAIMSVLGERCWYLPRWLASRPPARRRDGRGSTIAASSRAAGATGPR